MNEYIDKMLEELLGDRLDKPEAMMSILASHVLGELDRGTREGLLAFSERLTPAIRALFPKGDDRTYNDPVDLTNPVYAAYYCGMLSMAAEIASDRGCSTIASDDLVFLRKHPVIDILKHLNTVYSATDAEIADALKLSVEQVKTILDRTYEISATVYPLHGQVRINRLGPVGKQVAES